MLDILTIQPHKVSRDLRGYTVFLYGAPKSGKTTIASHFPKALLLACEKGYLAIPGIMAAPINSWGELKQVLIQLKKPEAKQMYETIIIDTVDIAWDLCDRYICSNNGVSSIGEIPYGGGYAKRDKEFDETLRTFVQEGYGLVMISHSVDKTFKNEQGQEFNRIVPTLQDRAANIVSRMSDIVGYSRIVTDENGNNVTKLFMRGTPRYMAGSRFPYTPDYIDFNYEALTAAIADSIDKQEAETNDSSLFTNDRTTAYEDTTASLDYDQIMGEFTSVVATLMEQNSGFFQPRITQIIEKYLGKGKKVSEASRDQVEALNLILTEVKDMLK